MHASPGRCSRRTRRCARLETTATTAIVDDETVTPAPGEPDQLRRRQTMPTNERGPGVRLSSGPEHSLLTNRPVIVTQSDLPSSSPPPLQQRGSPYSPYSGLVDKLGRVCT